MLKLVDAINVKIENVQKYCEEFSDIEDINFFGLWMLKEGNKQAYLWEICNPSSLIYYLIDDLKPQYIIGICGITFRNINPDIGNIAYGIRPSERQKGYATKMLHMASKKCEEMGVPEVFVSCGVSNISSRRVIEKNGGEFIKKFHDAYEGDGYKYKITLHPQLNFKDNGNEEVKRLFKMPLSKKI